MKRRILDRWEGQWSELVSHALLLVVAILGTGWTQAAASAQWHPEQNVEIVVGSSAGGSQDRTARTIQRIWRDRGIISAQTTVVNKSGGGGSVGWNYLNQHTGNGHVISTFLPTLLVSHIMGRNPLTHADFSPIAKLFEEYGVFSVKPDSTLGSVDDLANRLRSNPSAVSIGIGAGIGSGAYLAMVLAMRAAGVDIRKLKFVVFDSSAETVTALLGGHVDIISSSPVNVLPHLAAHKVRVLAIAAPQRLPGPLSTIPTLKEQGINAVFGNWRGVMGPKGLTREQISYWDQALRQLTKTQEWSNDVEKNLWSVQYVGSDEIGHFLDAQMTELRSVLTQLGIAR